MTQTIRLSKSTISEADKAAVLAVLDSEYLGMGTTVQQFELELQTYLGTDREAVCVNSGTAALHLALLACGIGAGHEVLVPSITYVASFQAVAAAGARPVACDVRPDTLFIDLEDAASRISTATRAIMPVLYASDCQHVDGVLEFARSRDLRVIQDAAHAFGSRSRGRLAGSFGDIACFSFDGIKNITAGEGGALVSEDKAVLQKVRDARLLGVEKDTEKRFQGQRSWEFDVREEGYRYHMSNIMAGLGRSQLKRIEKIREIRQSIARRYREAFCEVSQLEILPLDYSHIIPHIFVVRVKNRRRNELRHFLAEKGIESGIHYFPNHLLTKFCTPYRLPVAEQAYEEILSLPCHLDLDGAAQERVVEGIKEFFHG